jgi:hypothetical protein
MRAILRFSLLSALALAAACGGDESDVAFAGGEPVQLSEGDVRITSRNGAIDLMLLGDQITVGLSDSALNEIRRETDTAALESSGGVGATIEKFVKSKVQSTLAKRIDYPLADVRDVKYEGGRIVFEYVEGAKFSLLENAEADGVPFLASFSDDDAERFVEAVKARLE